MEIQDNILRDDLKRTLILWQLFKQNLGCIQKSETIKEWSQLAKENKNKSFVDFRILAGEQIRHLDGMILKMKKTMQPETWNAVMTALTSEQIKEIDLLLDEITVLSESTIEEITTKVKEAKKHIK